MTEKKLYQKIENMYEDNMDIMKLKQLSEELIDQQTAENEKVFYCTRLLGMLLENQDKLKWSEVEDYVSKLVNCLFDTIRKSPLQYFYKAGFEEQILIAHQDKKKRKCYQYLLNSYKENFDSFVFTKKKAYYKKLSQKM